MQLQRYDFFLNWKKKSVGLDNGCMLAGKTGKTMFAVPRCDTVC